MTMKTCSIWGEEDYDRLELELDCLLPSGFIVEITVQKNATIKSIKEDLWNEMKKFPFGALFGSSDQLTLECINDNSETVKLTDESKCLYDVRPFYNMLKVQQCAKQRFIDEQQAFNNKLNILIGRNVEKMEETDDAEVKQFRKSMKRLCYEIQAENDTKSWLEKVMRLYPPNLNLHALPSSLHEVCKRNKIYVIVKIAFEQDKEQTFSSKLEVFYDILPEALVKLVSSKVKTSQTMDPSKHLLKVPGYQEYLIGEHPLYQFSHVRQALICDKHPELSLVSKESVFVPGSKASSLPSPAISPPPPHVSSVFEFENNFRFSISSVTTANELFSFHHKPSVRACIYQGGEAMCDVVVFQEKALVEGSASFGEMKCLDIKLQNIPRMARLCLLFYADIRNHGKKSEMAKKPSKKKDMKPLAWLNIAIFDHVGRLRHGSMTFNMWPVTEQNALDHHLLHPLGTVESRPDAEEGVSLTVTFDQSITQPVYFPAFPDVLEVAAEEMKKKKYTPMAVDREHLRELNKRLNTDAFHLLAEQDKELIWSLRVECREHFPESLSTLLTCVKWYDHKEVATMQALLQIWPEMEPREALELLDFQYADVNVRSFAVRCLDSLSDSDVCMYLLQLVQALKYESYLDTDLIRFLLRRALNNSKIGYSFFWLLRSEMHVASVSVRFGLFLEAYCRGSAHQLDDLCKIVEALNNLRQLNDHIKVCGLASDKLKEEVRKGLSKKYKEVLSQFSCPINPSVKLQSVRIDKCTCMNSKMKPLWLVWRNVESFGNDMQLMFKKGDDLRQDMLTLQIMKIMDDIWQKNGLDLRMNVYSVLPTSQKEGLIEVVTDARTQAYIQMRNNSSKVPSSFNNKSIYQWLEEVNPNRADFEKAMDVFTLSCAGYTVATYVLGVADRHSDNIMIRKTGQLFHIDFGHILGNVKYKFGVNREPCPFVLTTDYVYVIKRGNEKDERFKMFEGLCERAFMILRNHSKFLITLFLMMMNTGIPEISGFKDIEFLKNTLVPHMSDQDALQHFRTKMTQAIRKSWKTSLNHMIHNLKKAKT